MEETRTLTNKRERLLETAAIQIVAVFAWLWIVPVIDSFDSYSYGTATRGVILSLIPFVIGVIAAVNFSNSTNNNLSRYAIIVGCILLLTCLVFYIPLYKEITWTLVRYCRYLRLLGFAFLGYGLQAASSRRQISFKCGVIILIALYLIYNLLIWGMNNLSSIYMPLYNLANMAHALVRLALVVFLWKTLSVDSVKTLMAKFSKISLLIAGLFWGMFFVIPANQYAPKWLAILMTLLAPIVAYVFSVIIRFTIKVIKLLVKVLSNRSWWKDVYLWWK